MKYYIPEPPEHLGEETLKQKIERIDDFVKRFYEYEETEKGKKFKLPRKVKKKKLKNNFVIVFLIKTNGEIDIKFLPVYRDILEIRENKTLHLSASKYMFRYKGFPAIILPEYSLVPLDPRNIYMKTWGQKKMVWPEEFLIRIMEEGKLKGKGIGGKWVWVLVAGAVLIGIYLITEAIK